MAVQPTAQANTVTFTDRSTAQVDGKPVDQLNRQADAISFAFDNDEVSFMEGKDGDLLMIFSRTVLGELILRCKPSSRFIRDTVPSLRGREFSASFTDKNGATRFTVHSNFCTLVKFPDTSRGAPDLNVVEVHIKGAWNIAQ